MKNPLYINLIPVLVCVVLLSAITGLVYLFNYEAEYAYTMIPIIETSKIQATTFTFPSLAECKASRTELLKDIEDKGGLLFIRLTTCEAVR